MAKGFTKEQIKNAFMPKVKMLELPEYDTCIWIRKLTAEFLLDLQADGIVNGRLQREYVLKMIAQSVVDENNELVWTIDEVRVMEGEGFNKICEVVATFNGMNPNAVKEAQEGLKNDPLEVSASN